MQRGGTVGHRNRVLRAGHCTQRGLESFDRGPAGQPVTAQHVDDGRDVVFVDVLAPVGDRGRGDRRGHDSNDAAGTGSPSISHS